MPRQRLDRVLVARGLASDPQEAHGTIEGARVMVDGRPVLNPGSLVDPSSNIQIRPASRRASRAGAKLEGALEDLRLDVHGSRCLDAGAGHGGFTEVLLAKGVAHVVAVDVAYGELSWGLREDDRVTVIERTNVRTVAPDDLDGPFDLVVADLSFISLRSVLSNLAQAAGPDAIYLLLVKPQFEAGRDEVGEGGVVSDPAVWKKVLHLVSERCAELGLEVVGVAPSRVLGAEGNQEFFLHVEKGGAGIEADGQIERAVEQAWRA